VYEALDDETAIEGLEELPVQVIGKPANGN
jgi:hypothetical protein